MKAETEVLIKVLERSGGIGAEERKEVVGVNVRGGGGSEEVKVGMRRG